MIRETRSRISPSQIATTRKADGCKAQSTGAALLARATRMAAIWYAVNHQFIHRPHKSESNPGMSSARTG